MMPTKFIAVQCFQCLMMQVKQSKKSSNTWICVVCNQKQSVLHVFSEGYLAKDVRQFVQNFNMSQQPKLLHPNKVEEQDLEIGRISSVEDKLKKRTDWTEYLQYDEENFRGGFYEHECGKDAGENGFDKTLVVTKKPKVLHKELKLKDYSVGTETDDHLLKPFFPIRSDKKRHNAHTQDMKKTQDVCSDDELINPHSGIRNSIRKTFTIKKGDDKLTYKAASRSERSDCISPGEYKHMAKGVQTVHKTVANMPVSKWINYITEEDEDDHDLQIRDSKNSKFYIQTQMISSSFEPLVNDIKVEDEVHIDFIKGPESACQ